MVAKQDESGLSTDLPYQTLYTQQDYEAVIKKYLAEYKTNKEDELSGFYVSDALISLALMKSNNPPLPEESLIVTEEKDIIDIDLARALSEVGPNIWPVKVQKLYGKPNLCILNQLFKTKKDIYDYQKRYIAIFVNMGKYSTALAETEKLKVRSISVDEPHR